MTTFTRSETATAALAYIRRTLSDAGHRVHAPSYWEDRGLRVSRLPDETAVAHCSWCIQAAQRGGFSMSDAQRQAWHAHGFPHDVEEAAQHHYDTTHAMGSSR